MIILFLIFLIQFSVGIACLAVNTDQEMTLLAKTWSSSSNNTRMDIQKQLQCCSWNDNSYNGSYPSCKPVSTNSYAELVLCFACTQVFIPLQSWRHLELPFSVHMEKFVCATASIFLEGFWSSFSQNNKHKHESDQ